LTAGGVVVSLDDLSRRLLDSGRLAELVEHAAVAHVTTNPLIVAAALADEVYDGRIAALGTDGSSGDRNLWRLVTDDVRDACDVLAPVFAASDGVDGRVSVEVDPRLAHDAEATVTQGLVLVDQIGRDNVLVKVPATRTGLSAITDLLAAGISVNATVLFGLDRYRQVLEATWAGLEAAAAQGRDLSTIATLASVYVSRVDVEIGTRLDKLGLDPASPCRRAVALDLARSTYRCWQESLESPRWLALAERGARPPRLLFASVAPKDPALDNLHYLAALVLPGTVCTMPETLVETVAAAPALGPPPAGLGAVDEAGAVVAAVEELGVDLGDVYRSLETECLDRFNDAWEDALARSRGRRTGLVRDAAGGLFGR
jgi:transaldolase